jgi:hypothetical protein
MAGELNSDQQALLDLVADLALRGHDARPLHLAHQLKWSEERTRAVLAELVELGMIVKQQPREDLQ